MIESKHKDDRINVFVAFDNEEIGSATKQGAFKLLIKYFRKNNVFIKLYKKRIFTFLANSYILSVDGAHGAHPAYLHKLIQQI